MKRIVIAGVVVAAAGFCPAGNWSPEESNLVARTMIGNYIMAERKYFVPGFEFESPPIPSWFVPGRIFEMAEAGAGWTPEERKRAFDGYVRRLSTQNLDELGEGEQMLAEAVFRICGRANYTNCCDSLRALVMNPHGLHSVREVTVVMKLNGFTDEMTAFVEHVVTNTAVFSYHALTDATIYHAEKIRAADVSTPEVLAVRNRAVEMFYRTKGHIRWVARADDILTAYLPGYAMSSNRLVFLETALANPKCLPATRERFAGITNELHSSGSPLPWRKFYDWE